MFDGMPPWKKLPLKYLWIQSDETHHEHSIKAIYRKLINTSLGVNHFTYSALRSEQLVSSLGMVPCKLFSWSALIHCKRSYGMRMIKVSCASSPMVRERCFLLTVFVVHWVYQCWEIKFLQVACMADFWRTNHKVLYWAEKVGEKGNRMKCMCCLHTWS